MTKKLFNYIRIKKLIVRSTNLFAILANYTASGLGRWAVLKEFFMRLRLQSFTYRGYILTVCGGPRVVQQDRVGSVSATNNFFISGVCVRGCAVALGCAAALRYFYFKYKFYSAAGQVREVSRQLRLSATELTPIRESMHEAAAVADAGVNNDQIAADLDTRIREVEEIAERVEQVAAAVRDDMAVVERFNSILVEEVKKGVVGEQSRLPREAYQRVLEVGPRRMAEFLRTLDGFAGRLSSLSTFLAENDFSDRSLNLVVCKARMAKWRNVVDSAEALASNWTMVRRQRNASVATRHDSTVPALLASSTFDWWLFRCTGLVVVAGGVWAIYWGVSFYRR